MLRALLLYLSTATWARRLVTKWSVAWRVASRFVAGETLDDAVRVTRELNARGLLVTLDHLGELTTNPAEAEQATQELIRIVRTIEAEDLRAGISLKLTQLGLALDEALAAQHLRQILQVAEPLGIFVRIDMEDSRWVDATWRLFDQMWHEGFRLVGVVLQAYLYRSEGDLQRLARYPARVRLVKGAYKEPPEIAYPRKRDVNAAYDRLARQLLTIAREAGAPPVSEDGRVPPIPAIATHDEARIAYAQEQAERLGLPKPAVEFQMLYGIRRDLQMRLAQAGYPVRIYVPYGTEWYPYFMRRLAERPANLAFFLRHLFRG
ncbi:MAG: proline dehydrogenase [Chloroflexi bacterium]|nr:proline dehydrogenase [Chloroflexota bacterium]